MKITVKIVVIACFCLALTASKCKHYIGPTNYAIGVKNSSNTELGTLRFSYQMNDHVEAFEWLLTEKQYDAGDLLQFPVNVYFDGDIKYRVQLLDMVGSTVADTTLYLKLGFEHNIFYLFKYKADGTLDLETIITPL